MVSRILWAILGALYGLLAGLVIGWRHPAPESSEALTNLVIHRYVNRMRDAATTN